MVGSTHTLLLTSVSVSSWVASRSCAFIAPKANLLPSSKAGVEYSILWKGKKGANIPARLDEHIYDMREHKKHKDSKNIKRIPYFLNHGEVE